MTFTERLYTITGRINASLVRQQGSFSEGSIDQFISILFGCVSGFLVFYFLYFFGAYGIQQGTSYSGHSHLFRSVSFGLLTSTYLTVAELWIKPKMGLSGVKHLLFWYAGLIFLGVQLIFLLFNYFWNWQEWSLTSYGLISKEFPVMMLLPLAFYAVVRLLLHYRQPPEEPFALFASENGKDQLRIKLEDFVYASAARNYATIVYSVGGELRQHLIRKSLKRLEEELALFPEVRRCHRSYLVNRKRILAVKEVKGKVAVDLGDTALPVSRQFADALVDAESM